jgi:hypothetical protein
MPKMKYTKGQIAGTKILLDSLLGRREYPTLIALMSQLAGLVHSQNSESRASQVDIQISPPVTQFGGTEFNKARIATATFLANSFNNFYQMVDIAMIGYESALQAFQRVQQNKPYVWHSIAGTYVLR